MRGIIFTQFMQMIEDQQGLKMLNDIIDEADLPNGGAYTSGGYYELAELQRMLLALERRLDVPQAFLLRRYGEYLLKGLAGMFPDFFEVKDLKTFLMSIDHCIHVEVKKLYPNAALPKFQYDDPAETTLIMHYHSEAKLCHLGEGLIEGSSRHFNQEYSLLHTTCMHRGDDSCTFEITFYESE